MGQARDAADRMTTAMTTSRDLKALAACYSENAAAVTPDQGEITGREGTTEYLRQRLDTFTATQFEHIAKYESGNVAIDERYFIGTNTGDLQVPGGESMPATGRQLRVQDCDGMVVERRADSGAPLLLRSMQFLSQLRFAFGDLAVISCRVGGSDLTADYY